MNDHKEPSKEEITAELFFFQKFGNKITASESWVIRFTNEYATIKTKALEEANAKMLSACVDLVKENEDLIEENARLKKQDTIHRMEWLSLNRDCEHLEQSNAKLLEPLEAVVNFHPAQGIDVLKEYVSKVLKEHKK